MSQPQPAADAHTAADKLAAFDTVPLFMKSLPADTDTNDPALGALQSLAHDGTPDEVAHNFKEQGNEYFKGRRFREALGFYTQGVDAKPEDRALQEALLINRAACNLELKNYGSVLRDTSAAITRNPRSSKAYYRAALALLALDRPDDALDCCERCLAYDTDNKSMKDVRERARIRKAEVERKERERKGRETKEKEAKRLLDLAFKERNLITVPGPPGASAHPYLPHFDPDDPTHATLVLPVLFLYPQHATSDIIAAFPEHTPFAAHLDHMFPPSAPPPAWDKAGEYTSASLVVYAMTRGRRLLKVGRNMTLREVCRAAGREGVGEGRDGLEVRDGCVPFAVLPRGEVEKEWVERYKRERGF